MSEREVEMKLSLLEIIIAAQNKSYKESGQVGGASWQRRVLSGIRERLFDEELTETFADLRELGVDSEAVRATIDRRFRRGRISYLTSLGLKALAQEKAREHKRAADDDRQLDLWPYRDGALSIAELRRPKTIFKTAEGDPFIKKTGDLTLGELDQHIAYLTDQAAGILRTRDDWVQVRIMFQGDWIKAPETTVMQMAVGAGVMKASVLDLA